MIVEDLPSATLQRFESSGKGAIQMLIIIIIIITIIIIIIIFHNLTSPHSPQQFYPASQCVYKYTTCSIGRMYQLLDWSRY